MPHPITFERPPADPFAAFCQENHVGLPGAGVGPLAGLSFAIKDVFDVEGSRTGFGHPAWLASHEPAEATADAVSLLLAAGANLIGRTKSDELCYSISGENVHYGMPINPAARDRLPGGSSSGSAVAVAGGLVDFALGTDCGGSVRVPAAYCGLFGIRPTHGRIPLAGVSRFAPRFDTVGWFAADPALMTRVGEVLLGSARGAGFNRLIIATDAFDRSDAGARAVLETGVDRLSRLLPVTISNPLASEGLGNWLDSFRTVQAGEIWRSLGSWVEDVHPTFGEGVGQRLAAAAVVETEAISAARIRADAIAAEMSVWIGGTDLICLPTTPGVAPLRSASSSQVETDYRRLAMELLCPAGLGGLPQLTLPIGTVDGAPVGLSIMARRGKDMDLLDLAARYFAASALMPET